MTQRETRNTSTSATEARGIKLALLAYAILVALQLFAFYSTSILVFYAQALEMLSDIMVSTFFLVSFYWSRKPADEFHMFGHGRAQNVAAVVSATILVFFMSLETFREAIPKLFRAPEASSIQNESYALIAIIAGMIIIAVPSIDILRVKAKGASVKAQLVALLKDEVSFVAAFVAVLFVGWGYYVADAVASLFVASVIALGGLYLLKINVHYLVGRAPSKEFFAGVESAAKSVNGILGIHDLKAEYVGPETVQASLHVEIENGTPVEVADRIAHEVERKVGELTHCQYCVIHVDPKVVKGK